MVSSTAMPMATVEISAVAVFNGIPASPIIPKLRIIGKELGIMLRKPILKDFRTIKRMKKMVTAAKARLLI
jgi:hypothetical protein